jgi:hypothetical protein
VWTATHEDEGDLTAGSVSTGCLIVVFTAVFVVLIVVPALVWTAGIVFGQ